MRSITIAAGVAAAALAFGAPAATAKAPDVTRETNPYGGSFDCSEAGYDFTMVWEGVEHVVFKDRFDDSGELIGFTFRIRFREVDTNTATGKTVVMRGSETENWDLVAGIRTLTGATFIGNQPGAGTFIQDTGRIVIDLDTGEAISIAGPHDGFHNGVDETVCAALAS
jgi:hypothetical protein